MAKVRRIAVIFVIAVLLSIFVFTTIDAFYPKPEYGDYCDNGLYESPVPYKPRPDNFTCPDVDFDESEMQECRKGEGDIRYEYDENRCEVSWECSYCGKYFNDAREVRNFWAFIIAALTGLIGVVVGLVLPDRKGSIHEWVGSGLMLGGMITIFVATAMYFSDLNRWVRPVIILLELLLVIYLAYKKLGD